RLPVGHEAGQPERCRQQRRGDRPENERPGEVHAPGRAPAGRAGAPAGDAGAGAAPGADAGALRSRTVGSTRALSWTFSAPSTMSVSPAATPWRTATAPPSLGPSCTRRSCTIFSGVTT